MHGPLNVKYVKNLKYHSSLGMWSLSLLVLLYISASIRVNVVQRFILLLAWLAALLFIYFISEFRDGKVAVTSPSAPRTLSSLQFLEIFMISATHYQHAVALARLAYLLGILHKHDSVLVNES